jgi:hypothetical protein
MSEDQPSGLKARLLDVAPGLAHALGGPLAGRAARVLAEALGAKGEGATEIGDALRQADPETLKALKLADYAFREAQLRETTARQRVDAGDRADARAREKAVGDNLPGILAVAVVAGFFGVLLVMMTYGLPNGAETEFSLMLGALAAMAASVMNYYFGSSASSRTKTMLLSRGEVNRR